MRRTNPSVIVLPTLATLVVTPAYASGGGEVLFLMFAGFALLPFAVLGPILAFLGYASAPEDRPSSARSRAAVGAVVAYVISYMIIYLWLVVGA